ncbi:MAG: sucrase ferredoxin [Ornithinibacter sp.]
MALTDLSRCSVAFRDRGDPLAGSAPVASRWLLIEHPGPWSPEPLETPPLQGAVGAEVERSCAAFGGRVLLIRRPGRRGSVEGERSWFAVDTVRGTWVHGLWHTAADLVRAVTSLGVELSNSDDDAPPMVLVCTHAMRDACCAVRGRPIATSLARTWPDEVWECTHLGGHRFAGTLLSLPDGACYGRLDPDMAESVVARHRDGLAEARYLRGTTRWEPAVQAALAEVLRAGPPGPVDDAVPGSVDVDGDVTMVEVFGRGALPEVTWVRVVAEALPEVPLSCGGKPKAHTAYRCEIIPV